MNELTIHLIQSQQNLDSLKVAFVPPDLAAIAEQMEANIRKAILENVIEKGGILLIHCNFSRSLVNLSLRTPTCYKGKIVLPKECVKLFLCMYFKAPFSGIHWAIQNAQSVEALG